MGVTNGSGVPHKQYGCTLFRYGTEMFAQAANSTFLLLICPLCTIGAGSAKGDSVRVRTVARPGKVEAVIEGHEMDSGYAAWIGLPVVLQVALGDIKVPLRGKLLKDGGDTVRMRIGDGWDVDIYKAMILAVEEDAMGLMPA